MESWRSSTKPVLRSGCYRDGRLPKRPFDTAFASFRPFSEGRNRGGFVGVGPTGRLGTTIRLLIFVVTRGGHRGAEPQT